MEDQTLKSIIAKSFQGGSSLGAKMMKVLADESKEKKSKDSKTKTNKKEGKVNKKTSKTKTNNIITLSLLTCDELRFICETYGSTKSGTKEVLLQRIAGLKNFKYTKFIGDLLKSMKLDTLRKICEEVDETKSGLKVDIIKRLVSSGKAIKFAKYLNDGSDDVKESQPTNEDILSAINLLNNCKISTNIAPLVTSPAPTYESLLNLAPAPQLDIA
jgi:hypothetical protein